MMAHSPIQEKFGAMAQFESQCVLFAYSHDDLNISVKKFADNSVGQLVPLARGYTRQWLQLSRGPVGLFWVFAGVLTACVLIN